MCADLLYHFIIHKYAFNPTFNEKPLSDRLNYVYTIYIHTYKIFLYKFMNNL